MRILTVTFRHPPYVVGGYEIVTGDTVESLQQRGHDVVVLTGKGKRFEGQGDVMPWLEPGLDGEEDPLQAAWHASSLESFRLHFLRLSNLAATRRAIRSFRPDVVLACNLGLVSLAPILAARVEGIPTLGLIADPWPDNHWVREWRRRAAGSASRPMRLVMLERAWRVFRDSLGLGPLCVSSAALGEELVRGGISARSIDVLPLGIPPEMETRAAGSTPAPREGDEPLRICCTSSHWEGKGIHVLLEAVAIAARAGVPVDLCLAGEGDGTEYGSRLADLAENPVLAGRVHFEGRVSPERVAALLQESHVLAMPSTWNEPFGLSVVEAMAHGTAVVTSDAGALAEIVQDGTGGLVVSAGDAESLATALQRLAADETQRMTLARSGQARVREVYGWKRYMDGLEGHLERAVS